MQTAEERLALLDTTITELAGQGLTLQRAEDATLDGRTITLAGRRLVNFGSCSYLGLELDPRLRQGVCDAVMRYGTQFSSSRSYVSAPAYAELEALLEELFGGPTLVAASTSLGHLSALPVLVGEGDAVLLDQMVHNSVQVAVNLLRTQGVTVELVRHNRMDALERRFDKLRRTHRNVWYMADGVYSMYADLAPAEELAELVARHEQLHLYLDDSHGVSWAGRHGRGPMLDRLPSRERTVVAASLNKAFAASGGALVFPDAELKRRVATCGATMIFSGPVQPPMLGAAIASARLHLSPELEVLQAELQERVARFNRLAHDAGLPLVAPSDAPIRFVGCGLPAATAEVADRLRADGFYVNCALFPAVAMKKGGIRTPLTVHHTAADIEGLVAALAEHVPAVLEEHGSSVEQVAATFGLEPPAAARSAPRPPALRLASALRLERFGSIRELDAQEWDGLLGDRGSFSAEGLRLLEDTFAGGRPEDDWRWVYYVVRGADGEVVLATFFTEALWKDDMLAPAAVSREVEARRREDPYHLTSRTFAMGSLLTEGEHLFLDRARDWRGALALVLDAAAAEQERRGAATLVVRDLDPRDEELGSFLRGRGLVAVPMPDALLLEGAPASGEELLASLSPKARAHQRREVLRREAAYEVEVLDASSRVPDEDELRHLHGLYLAVKERGLDLTTFDLPLDLFRRMLATSCWELVLLRLRPEHGGPQDGRPVAFGAHFVGRGHYAPMVVGLDYGHVHEHGAYRQALWQAIRRGREVGAQRILLGMGAGLEKRRFGAVPHPRCAYARAADHFSSEVLASVQADVGAGRVAA